MIVAIQGSRNFDDYAVFLTAMTRILSRMPEGDREILIYSAGPVKVNSMVMEFSNVSERGLKARGIRNKYFKVPTSWIKDNMHTIDHFAYLCKKKESASELVQIADAKDVDVMVYRF
jgi:hypothetical protein